MSKDISTIYAKDQNQKEAEKCLRQLFPHMRVMNDTLVSDANGTYVLEVREEEV